MFGMGLTLYSERPRGYGLCTTEVRAFRTELIEGVLPFGLSQFQPEPQKIVYTGMSLESLRPPLSWALSRPICGWNRMVGTVRSSRDSIWRCVRFGRRAGRGAEQTREDSRTTIDSTVQKRWCTEENRFTVYSFAVLQHWGLRLGPILGSLERSGRWGQSLRSS